MMPAIVITLFGVAAFLFYASYSIGSGVYVKALCRLPKPESGILLTFDDGPDPVQTAKVLDVLREYRVRAVFFVVGERARQNPELVRRMLAEGHRVGIHSWRHQSTFPLQGADSLTADLRRCCETLQSITGEAPVLFRPPFGVTNPPLAKAVKRLGLRTIGWSIRSYDTALRRPRGQVAERIFRRLHPGAVVLLHDNRPNSEILLRRLIEGLQERSYILANPDV